MIKWWLTVVIAVVVGAGAFYGGTVYGQSKPPTPQKALEALRNMTPEQMAQGGGFPGGGFPGGGGNGARGGGAGGGFVGGDIVAQDAQSITVKLPDGSTKIVFYSGTTTISKSASGTASDLATGTGGDRKSVV